MADTQTAMLLTQQEWDDLTDMVTHYKLCTQWVERETPKHGSDRIIRVRRRRALADRIIDANS